jgi:hypothetical protein
MSNRQELLLRLKPHLFVGSRSRSALSSDKHRQPSGQMFNPIFLFPNLKAWVFWIISTTVAFAQDCPQTVSFTPVQQPNQIEWAKLPVFTLPFKIVYEGPRFGDTQSSPLQHGFSHLARFSGNEGNTLRPDQRAVTWYGVATAAQPQQPWADKELKSPWNNNLDLYKQGWENTLSSFATNFGSKTLNYNLIALDLERIRDSDRDILLLKSDSRIAAQYRNMSDNQFIERYKRDLKNLYTEPITYLKNRGITAQTQIGSYSDVPIRGNFNNWLGLKTFSWKDYTTDVSSVLHVVRDSTSGNVGGAFYDNLHFLTPSCYYYYNYNDPLGKDYLAYLLFVIEANRYWSNKDIIPFVWLNYHDSFNPSTPFVPRFVAEATAIMPFFSGAKGLWLWGYPDETKQENFATYEYFIAALHRLSQHKRFFEGNYELVIPQPAIENAQSQTPIWRGVVKGNEILIAAQNPYANSDSQVSTIMVKYQNWQKEISLTGREVFLCSFDKSVVNALKEKIEALGFAITPNVVNERLNYRFATVQKHAVNVALIDAQGRACMQETFETTIGTQNRQMVIAGLPMGTYFLCFKMGNFEIREKVVVVR